MKSHHEIELKWSLTKDSFQQLSLRLTDMLGQGQVLEQKNHFFDTADRRLRSSFCNIRLRHENGRLLLTCKKRIADPDSALLGTIAHAHRHEEWETWIEGEQRAAIEHPGASLVQLLPLPVEIRAVIGDDALITQGGFDNQRITFYDADHFLCLDSTLFPGNHREYELEIETNYPIQASERWSQLLNDWGIIFQHQPLSKFARYLAYAGADAAMGTK